MRGGGGNERPARDQEPAVATRTLSPYPRQPVQGLAVCNESGRELQKFFPAKPFRTLRYISFLFSEFYACPAEETRGVFLYR